jgi:hypothetical protein
MAKTRTKAKSKSNRDRDILRTANAPLVKSPMNVKKPKPQKSIIELLTEATTLLEQSQPELALPIAEEALRRLEEQKKSQNGIQDAEDEIPLPSVVVLLGETQLSIGNIDAARLHFNRATSLDPTGAIVSAEPWLWLAQLSEMGGAESIRYFSQATQVLRREIGFLEDQAKVSEEVEMMLEEKQSKLADALCGMAEVYMTDLSWEADAEDMCERLVTEAMTVVPEEKSAGTLQCLASVRISQERTEEARGALRKSLEVWKDDEEAMPEFPSRISLARLLMEVGMLEEGMVILEGLVREDDQSVEAWYLGGWCQVLRCDNSDIEGESKQKIKEGARQWLKTCLQLYETLGYEDERLKEHATELAQDLDHDLGFQNEGEDEEEDNEWEDEEGDDIEADEDLDNQCELEDVDMT